MSGNAIKVLEKRYLKKKEGRPAERPVDMFRRVANNIAQADAKYGATPAKVAKTEELFLRLIASRDFLPNSPCLMNAGRDFQQLSACFVLPVEDSIEGIFETLKHQAIIHQSGGGTGFSFSRLRPKGSLVKTTHGVASGPVSFMRIFNTATDIVKQGGTRRGANMGVLRVDHPDILGFIKIKEDLNEMRNFNISVAVTEKFMAALQAGKSYDLVDPHNGVVTGQLDAREVWNLLIHHAWLTGDPGVLFIDRANATNPARHVETLEATNPCGEQWLAGYDSCNLGSINLGHFVKKTKTGKASIDWARLKKVTVETVHFLDNVIDMNRFPVGQIAEKTLTNRRIGLGVMGFADLLIELEIPYNSKLGLETARKAMKFINDEATRASSELAASRGNFPNYAGSEFEKQGLPMRNVARTTVAPTGTISMIADCSSGLEPLFAIVFTKTVMDGTSLVYVHPKFEETAKREGWYSPELMERIAYEGSIQKFKEVPDKWKKVFVTAADCSPEDHVRMQAAFQEHVDNSISKTVNFPHEASEEDVRKVYDLAYELGCKGITIFRDGSRDEQVLTTGKTVLVGQDKQATAVAGLAALTPRERPEQLTGTTYRVNTPYGSLYITINDDPDGKPFEVFATIGKNGGFFAAQSESICRMISLALRTGIAPEEIVDQLKGIRGPDVSWHEGGQILSLSDAVGKILEKHLKRNQQQLNLSMDASAPASAGVAPTGPTVVSALQSNGKKLSVANVGYAPACPDCGTMLEIAEGCMKCHNC
ncbi:MAG: vitamin B12-dependent ribonucleotide reductase, partial [Candidatus Kerfeldbacteria bacterium]|nr:vitamin B12-dependent ribonucleotide reductase [Candidatus Kerfeldbacteria bacterium]